MDLPALGRPMIETKPERRGIVFIMRCCLLRGWRVLDLSEIGGAKGLLRFSEFEEGGVELDEGGVYATFPLPRRKFSIILGRYVRSAGFAPGSGLKHKL